MNVLTTLNEQSTADSTEPADDVAHDLWSAAWNKGYRDLSEEEWMALAEKSA